MNRSVDLELDRAPDRFSMPWVDIASLALGVGSALLSAVSLYVAWWQLSRTRKASEAASEAARVVASRLQEIAEISHLERLVTYAEMAIAYVHAKQWGVALVRVGDLRAGLMRARYSARLAPFRSPQEWQQILANLGTVESQMTRRGRSLDAETIGEVVGALAEVRQEVVGDLSKLAATVPGSS